MKTFPKAQLRLNVPFEENYKAKELGARWDMLGKFWYVPYGTDINLFRNWWPETLEKQVQQMNERAYKKQPKQRSSRIKVDSFCQKNKIAKPIISYTELGTPPKQKFKASIELKVVNKNLTSVGEGRTKKNALEKACSELLTKLA